jgi:DNA-binding transcriptional MerR regulator
MKRNREASDRRTADFHREVLQEWRQAGFPLAALHDLLDRQEPDDRFAAIRHCRSVLNWLLNPSHASPETVADLERWILGYIEPQQLQAARVAYEDSMLEGEMEQTARMIAKHVARLTGHSAGRADAEYRRRRLRGISRRDAWEAVATDLPRAAKTTRRMPPRPAVTCRSVARRRGAGRPRAGATRSSVKSGDSGSDGEPGSPPPSRIAWRHLEQQHAARTRAHLRGVRS